MSLRKDGSSKRSASHMPYASEGSFVRRMANRVTGLVGWSSQSQSSVISQNYDNVSNSVDEDDVSPTPKRIRMQSEGDVSPTPKRIRTQNEDDDTLFRLIPSASRGTNELCSPIQPVSNIKIVNANNRSQCFVASTPADIFSSTAIQPNLKHQTQDSNVTDSFDDSGSVDISSTIPQFNIHQRHNVTVPAIFKEASSQVSNVGVVRKTEGFSVSNPRKPSFNVDTFSSSSKQFSTSISENRKVNSLSPFYSARTIYGGASALLPYGSPSVSRLRSASASKLDLFAPRRQITIQPVSPSPTNYNNDQETMSASARRILDALEKYCSPVKDAKKIPLREVKKPAENTSQTTAPPKGTKRKLPSLDQITPNMTDLLRIKRREKIQDSVSNARQAISSVCENTIAAEDSDASSDSADLDYCSLTSDTNTKRSQKYVGKTRRKDKAFDHDPLPPFKLPNAVLKITNLPKFDITDTFTFSKPLLLENFEQNLAEENSEPTARSASAKNASNPLASSQTSSSSMAATSNVNKLTPPSSSSSPSSPSSELSGPELVKCLMSQKTPRQIMNEHLPSWNEAMLARLPPTPKASEPWTCKVCLLESNEEPCSVCNSPRPELKKKIDIAKPVASKSEPAGPSTTLTSGGWGDKFKAASDTWECKECFVRNANTANKCAACESPKPGCAPSTPAVANVASNSSELSWKNVMQKPTTPSAWSFGMPAAPKVEPGEKQNESSKPAAALSFGFDGTDGVSKNNSATEIASEKNSNDVASSTVAATKPTYSFGFTSPAPPKFNSSNDSGLTKTNVVPPAFSSEYKMEKKAPAAAGFTFGAASKSFDATDPGTCNAIGMKTSVTEGDGGVSVKNESEKSGGDLKRSTNVFNDVSSITNTNNARNPLLKPAATAEAATANDLTPFRISKGSSMFETASANKENGDDKSASGKSLFGASAGSAAPESPSKKKGLFASYSSASVTTSSNIFGNGFAKPEYTNSTLTNNIAVGSAAAPSTNVFANSFTQSSKPTNEVAPSSFGVVANKVDSISANDTGKGAKLFPGANNNFVATVSPQQQQQTTSNSLFGGFAAPKMDMQSTNAGTFNATPMFSFGKQETTTQSPAVGQPQQQLAPGGFSFNGPKADDTKFMFGGPASTNFSTNSSLGGNVNAAAQFTNPAGPTNALSSSGSGFSFGSPIANDQTKPANSIFASSATPSLTNNTNSVPTFGSSVFGNASQPPSQPMNATKKPGGFSFPSPSPRPIPIPVPVGGFAAQQAMNNFGSFGNTTTKKQDELISNSSTTSNASAFAFGPTSVVPQTFNFTGNNSVPSFSNYPAPGERKQDYFEKKKLEKEQKLRAKESKLLEKIKKKRQKKKANRKMKKKLETLPDFGKLVIEKRKKKTRRFKRKYLVNQLVQRLTLTLTTKS